MLDGVDDICIFPHKDKNNSKQDFYLHIINRKQASNQSEDPLWCLILKENKKLLA